MENTVPELDRKEWTNLIEGKSKPPISSFSLQMKINSLMMGYKSGLLSLKEAANNLRSMCVKYEKLYKDDLKIIFNH